METEQLKRFLLSSLGAIGPVLLIIGTFSVWATVKDESGRWVIYGYSFADGGLLLSLGIIGLILVATAGVYLRKSMAIGVMAIGILSLMICLYEIMTFSAFPVGRLFKIAGREASSNCSISVGIGLYLGIIGSIVILVVGLILLVIADEEEKDRLRGFTPPSIPAD